MVGGSEQGIGASPAAAVGGVLDVPVVPVNDEALLFGAARSLVGIVTNPPQRTVQHKCTGFIFLNSGILHRVGTNRLAVRIARGLATLGYVGLRFDFSGIGDSPARSDVFAAKSGDYLSIEKRWIGETQEAMSYLGAAKGIGRFVLVGSCSGAYFALQTALHDPRVAGVVLISLPTGTKTPLQLYIRLLLKKKLWVRLLRGKVKLRPFANILISDLRSPLMRRKEAQAVPNLSEALRALIERDVKVLLVHCEWDWSYEYFRVALRKEMRGYNFEDNLSIELIPDVKHDFNLLRGQNDLQRIVHDWALQNAH